MRRAVRRAWPSGRGGRSTSSRWTPPRTTRSSRSGSWSSGPGRRPRTFVARSTSIDEVQRIDQGWDVLLKTLEEPPDHVVFIFCTTDPTQIRPAVLSRVQRFDFRRLTVAQIEGKLATILESDGRVADPAAIGLVARQAAGGMRDAESMLDQLLSSTEDRLTEASVRDLLGLVDAETIASFADALVVGDPLAGIAILDGLEDAGRDLGAFIDQVVVVVRAALGAHLAGEAELDRATWTGPALVDAARRLASIDPSRPGAGGVRLQIELALLTSGTVAVERSARSAVTPKPSPARVAVAAVPVAMAPPAASAQASGGAPPDAATTAPTEAPSIAPAPAAASASTTAARTPSRKTSSGGRAESLPATPASSGASPAKPVPAPIDPPPAVDVDELRALDRIWPSIVADLSTSPPLKPLVTVCRPIDVNGDVVTLGFPEGMAFLKDVAERRRPNLEAGIGRALGRPVSVRLVATNLDVLPPPVDDEAERIVAAARRIFADDLVDAGEVT